MTGPDPDLYEIAAAHFARMEAGLADDAEIAAIEAWCAQSAGNRAAFDAMSASWNAAGPAGADPAIAAMLADIGSRYPDAAAAPARRWPRWAPMALAASLAMAAALPAAWWLTASPEGARPGAAPVKRAAAHQVFESPFAAQRQVRLPDGSQLTLDRDSRISIAFTPGRRNVTLERGRAFFAVSKNKARPFVVKAGNLSATAVGTAFAVSRRGASRIVTTTEGLVRVETGAPLRDGSHSAMVPAGMKLLQANGHASLAPVEADNETAWRNGRIVFSARCLASVVGEMNPYGKVHLQVDPGAARQAVSGVFDLDRARTLTDALEAQGLVRVTVLSDTRLQLSRGPQADNAPCRP